MMDVLKDLPYGWKSLENPGNGPQGPYYCGFGGENSFGRELAEEHMNKCIEADV